MPVLLVLLLTVTVEVAVLVAVSHAIGVLPTIGLLILSSVVGAVLLRREGSRALRAFVLAVRTRKAPHHELLDGVLIAAAAVLIVVPGLVSDLLGLLLLVPPVRGALGQRILHAASRHTPVAHSLRSARDRFRPPPGRLAAAHRAARPKAPRSRGIRRIT
jgi:UPF0716 protein FxsA